MRPPQSSSAAVRSEFCRVVTIGSMIRIGPWRRARSARSWTGSSFVRQREANAAHAEKGIALTVRREARDRLVAAGIKGADGHRLAARPIQRGADRRRTAPLRPETGPRRGSNSVRTRPMPSQSLRSTVFSSSGPHVDVDRHRAPSAFTAGLPSNSRSAAPFAFRLARVLEAVRVAGAGSRTISPPLPSTSASPGEAAVLCGRGLRPSARPGRGPAWPHGWRGCRCKA